MAIANKLAKPVLSHRQCEARESKEGRMAASLLRFPASPSADRPTVGDPSSHQPLEAKTKTHHEAMVLFGWSWVVWSLQCKRPAPLKKPRRPDAVRVFVVLCACVRVCVNPTEPSLFPTFTDYVMKEIPAIMIFINHFSHPLPLSTSRCIYNHTGRESHDWDAPRPSRRLKKGTEKHVTLMLS